MTEDEAATAGDRAREEQLDREDAKRQRRAMVRDAERLALATALQASPQAMLFGVWEIVG
jgi:hypothetical protein